jgi:diguanylate cyclase (GGDEF)-like protein/PAS domain S-box-containing protein
MSSELSILIVEDRALDAELLEHELRRIGLNFKSLRVYTRNALSAALRQFVPDLILSDFSMPTDLDGFSALAVAREHAPDTPFIFVSGTIGEERAVDAMKAGATDYVLKDRLERLGPVVTRALQEARDRTAIQEAQNALRASESRFRSFMRHLPGRASISDQAGRYTYVNEYWQEAYGKSTDEVLGRSYDEVWDTEHAQRMRWHHDAVLASNKPLGRVFVGAEDDGNRVRWWLSHHFPVPGHNGEPTMVGSIALDITEQKLQEEKLSRLSRLHTVLSGINSAVIRIRDEPALLQEACRIAVEDGGFGVAWIGTWDAERDLVTPLASAGLAEGEDLRTSPMVLRGAPLEVGLIAKAVSERTFAICNDIRLPGVMLRAREEAIRRGFKSVIVLPLLVDQRVTGMLCLFARETNSFASDELKLLVQLAADVAFALEHMEKERRLQYLAWHDPLTSLGNRSLLQDRLRYAIEAAREDNDPLGVLVWDVKRFREINDTFGRDVGDQLLRDLAKRVAAAWPEVTEMARLSSDTFGGFTRSAHQASDIAHLLERSAALLAEPFLLRDSEIIVGLAVGIAFYPADGEDAETLLANAEAAVKQAKGRGERYLFYEPAMNARVSEKLALESKLRRALDKQQFELHYQQKVDLRTGAVEGLEALIRWRDPDGGLVAPIDFVPLLEETGLIVEVGKWAIFKALEDRASRVHRGVPTPRIAVNVSAIQLRRPDFVSIVAAELARCRIEAHGLDLELTESLLMHDIENNIPKLRALKEMGVQIGIDDFGTGYSSLSYLARLPVDALKIDRSFITTMADQAESMTIVSTIVSLAHALKLTVIAEGVELEEQAKLLRLLNCDQAQGYLFSRPLPWNRCFDDA